MPDVRRWHVECAQFLCELFGIVDQGQQINQRDQLAVVETAGDKARITVATLFAVGYHRQPQGAPKKAGWDTRCPKCVLSGAASIVFRRFRLLGCTVAFV